MEQQNEKRISIAARRKMARAAKRTARKRALKKKLLAKRPKSAEKLKNTAKKAAKNVLVKKLTGGRPYSELSITQKQTIDRKLKPSIITKVAKKLLPKVRAKEKERLKRIRSGGNDKPNPLNEVVDPVTIATIVGITGGAVAITATLAKKISDILSSRNVKFDVGKTYKLIKKKYPHIFTMIKDQKFGKGHLAKFIKKIKDEIPGLNKNKSIYATTNIINQLMKHHITHSLGITDPKLDADRFQRESKEGKHGVLTLRVNGSQPEVSAHYVDGKLKPYVFKTREDAKKHCKKVGGKPFESIDTGRFYVEFTKIDGPNDMNENENEENLKDLKAILDVAKMLSDKSPYFKGRGSKKEYIKMLVHKIQKLSESKKKKLLSTLDAYKQVRKPTMPKSRPMKNKKAYDRKDLRRGKYD